MNSLRLLQFLLALIAAFHLVMGGGIMTSHGFQKAMVDLYGAQVLWTPQFIYAARIIGSFAFVIGIMALLAAFDPLRNSAIVWGIVALFVIRDLHRLAFAAEIEHAFALPARMNLLTNLFFLAQSVLLAGLLLHAQKKHKD